MFKYFTEKHRGSALRSEATKGFTLVELLVVIAIIGILASVVLVALAGARTRAQDTRVISSLNQIRTMAEIINSVDGNYNNVVVNADINTLMVDMAAQGGTSILRTALSTNLGYCVEVNMAGGRWGCVNSGLAIRTDLLPANAPGCAAPDNNNRNATSIACP